MVFCMWMELSWNQEVQLRPWNTTTWFSLEIASLWDSCKLRLIRKRACRRTRKHSMLKSLQRRWRRRCPLRHPPPPPLSLFFVEAQFFWVKKKMQNFRWPKHFLIDNSAAASNSAAAAQSTPQTRRAALKLAASNELGASSEKEDVFEVTSSPILHKEVSGVTLLRGDTNLAQPKSPLFNGSFQPKKKKPQFFARWQNCNI